MKNKRIHKLAVPLGLIWWNEMKRHPLNQYAGRVIHRQRTDRGLVLEDLAEAAGLFKSFASLSAACIHHHWRCNCGSLDSGFTDADMEVLHQKMNEMILNGRR